MSVGDIVLCDILLLLFINNRWVSHRFVKVLLVYAEINKVPLDSKIIRIVRMTWAANAFFMIHAFAEGTVAVVLVSWQRHYSFIYNFEPGLWIWYVGIKHISEGIILALMLWILHSSPTSTSMRRRGSARVSTIAEV